MSLSALSIDENEVLRYMGCPPERADKALREQARLACSRLAQTARPRWAWRCFDVTAQAEGVRLSCGLLLPGRDLKRHLEGCERAALFCATLGAGVDRLIRRWESVDMARALALDGCAAAAAEELCDQIERAIQSEFPGCSFPYRFSPGYGDFSLECQPALLVGLEAGKRIGITLTGRYLMAPSKSVTAAAGISPVPAGCVTEGCEACGKTDCAYRRDEA